MNFVIEINDNINTTPNYFSRHIKHATVPSIHRNCKEIRHIVL